ncbi:exosome complex component RRP40-like [Artemia franciscana]
MADILIAGDYVDSIPNDKNVVLGPGLRKVENRIVACKSGKFKSRDNPPIFWIEACQKQYIPAQAEEIIGIIQGRIDDFYKVDIGSSESALLSFFAFPGATKKNRPIFKEGELVYAKVLLASKDMEPELVCISGDGKSGGLGQLSDDGFLFRIPINHARRILRKESNLIKNLGKEMKFEAAIGLNGRVWVRGKNTQQTLAVANAITTSERMSEEEINDMCENIFDSVSGMRKENVIDDDDVAMEENT